MHPPVHSSSVVLARQRRGRAEFYLFLAGLAVPALAFAQVALTPQLSVSGYVTASSARVDYSSGEKAERTDIDAAKLMGTFEAKPFGAVASAWYQPQAPSKVALLDAYVSLDLGRGVVARAGKFLSYLGYESFDLPDLNQISYANGEFLAVVPGYHSGVKVDYANDAFGAGAAVVDSVYSGSHYLRGDGELRHNGGFEAYVTYKAVPGLTLWAGGGVDTRGNTISCHDEILVGDVWATYAWTKATTLAAEFAWKAGVPADEGHNWLLAATHVFTDRWSCTGRLSGESLIHGGPEFTKLTFSPAFRFNPRLLVRAEYSRYRYARLAPGTDSARFIAVQIVARF